MQGYDLGVLDEANVLGVLTEAATAQVEAVLADDAVRVVAHAAATRGNARTVSSQCEEQAAAATPPRRSRQDLAAAAAVRAAAS